MRHVYRSIPKTLIALLAVVAIAVAACSGGGDSDQEAEKSGAIKGPAFAITNTAGQVGSQVKVPIEAIDVEGLAGFKIVVTVDPSSATFSEIEQGDFVGSFLFVENIDAAKGTVSIAAVADKSVSGSGNLAVLTITLGAKGESQISLTIGEALGEAGNPITVTPHGAVLSAK